ncbi:putative DNA-binding protein (MmcQ/YjbR family) [Silvibacterium bohemicum]|uniref:Putative DNA-binding protein (MmcQ/YjbR family) n=1 Tax=Silvibacterium bohemicum TaxID=1577686 RepID=A0A841K0S4_9BACT|nr:MmcQ/YjbR family DNA-binding protein [Silvibacterium bohemicum]MBB6147146.1 putative DNA-binding protein (MmcQ/YjbR family) [Silvibacterium bohemicum]
MNVELLRAYLLSLPHVEETVQWGDNLVFWVADKAIGGKMFALANLSPDSRGVLSFAAGPERYAELLEIEGAHPAPYLARAYWIAIERYDVFSSKELKNHLRNAYEFVYAKLPKRTRDVLGMPPAERKKLIAARKRLLVSQGK